MVVRLRLCFVNEGAFAEDDNNLSSSTIFSTLSYARACSVARTEFTNSPWDRCVRPRELQSFFFATMSLKEWLLTLPLSALAADAFDAVWRHNVARCLA